MGVAHQRLSLAFLIESLRCGGAERQLLELVSRLDSERFRSRVLTWLDDPFYLRQWSPLVPVHYLPRQGRMDPRPVWVAAQWLRSGEVDLVHGFSDIGNLYAAGAALLARRGVVVTSQRTAGRKAELLQRWHKPWAHRRSRVTVANSESGVREVLRLTGLSKERVRFIPNGLDLERFRPVVAERRRALRMRLGWPPEARVLLTVGTFSRVKNHEGLVEIYRLLAPRDDLFICWIGDQETDHISTVRAALDALPPGRQVHLRPAMSAIETAYQAADLLVHASLREGTPNVVLEAMACGCPVVGTDVGDMARYVRPGETGWLAPSDDLESLLSAVEAASDASIAESARSDRTLASV